MNTEIFCPARSWHYLDTPSEGDEEHLMEVGPDTYECTCGCVFAWTGPNCWWVLQPGQGMNSGQPWRRSRIAPGPA